MMWMMLTRFLVPLACVPILPGNSSVITTTLGMVVWGSHTSASIRSCEQIPICAHIP